MSAMGRWRRRAATAPLVLVASVAWLPGLTGVPAHEWVGLAVAAVLLLHGARRLARLAALWRASGGRRWLAVMDGLLFAALACCLVSGVMVSGEVLAAFGLYAPGYFFWDPLHAFSAKLLLALAVVHGGVNLLGLARSTDDGRRTATSGAPSLQREEHRG